MLVSSIVFGVARVTISYINDLVHLNFRDLNRRGPRLQANKGLRDGFDVSRRSLGRVLFQR